MDIQRQVKERHDAILGLVLDQGHENKKVGRILAHSKGLTCNNTAAFLEDQLQCRITLLRDKALRALDSCDRMGIGLVFIGDPDYPSELESILDPPSVLFFRGKREVLNREALAIVGARRATSYGRQIAYEIAKAAARKQWAVVSGLAIGIDGAAHRGALDANGITMAVMAGSLESCYPKSHSWLFQRIIETGAVISEYAPGTEPLRWRFAERNRIVSGMSRAVIVAQAGMQSGSLITARCAAEQGRDVYCVPGSLFDPEYLGSHRLIQDGANIVTSIEELFSENAFSDQQSLFMFQPRKQLSSENEATKTVVRLKKESGKMEGAAGDWKWLLDAVDDFGCGTEELLQRTGKDVVMVQMGLSELEILGLIEHQGSLIVRKHGG